MPVARSRANCHEEKSELARLRNIGPTIEKRLNEIGIYTRADLEHVGPAKACQWIRRHYPDRTIPVCYYLYALQGALMDLHWDDLPNKIKEQLKREAQRYPTRRSR